MKKDWKQWKSPLCSSLFYAADQCFQIGWNKSIQAVYECVGNRDLMVYTKIKISGLDI